MAVVVGHILLISTQVAHPARRARCSRRSPSACSLKCSGRPRRGSARCGTCGENYFALQEIASGESGSARRGGAAARRPAAGARARRAVAHAAEAARHEDRRRSCEPPRRYVIAGGASPDFRTVTIDKGSRDGLRPDMAVISPDGVVGRIILPTARAAKVQLLIDRDAAAGAIAERSRAQGVVVGTGTSLRLRPRAGNGRYQDRRPCCDVGDRRHLPERVRNWSNRID